MQTAGQIFILIGTLFMFLGGLGVFRMPDVYNKLQAGTKATTLGFMSIALGVGLSQPQWLVKTLVLIAFISFTNPVSSSVLARAAMKRGIPARKVTKND